MTPRGDVARSPASCRSARPGQTAHLAPRLSYGGYKAPSLLQIDVRIGGAAGQVQDQRAPAVRLAPRVEDLVEAERERLGALGVHFYLDQPLGRVVTGERGFELPGAAVVDVVAGRIEAGRGRLIAVDVCL